MRHNIDTVGLVARILGPLMHSTTDAVRWLRLEIDMEPAASTDPAQDSLAPTAPTAPDGVHAMAEPLPLLISTPAPRRWERVSEQPPVQPSIAVRRTVGPADSGMASEQPEQAPHSRESAGHENNNGLINNGLIAPSRRASGLDVFHAVATSNSTGNSASLPFSAASLDVFRAAPTSASIDMPFNASGLDVFHPTPTSGSVGMPLVSAVRETSRPANTISGPQILPSAPRQIPPMTAAPAAAMTPVSLSATHTASPQASIDSVPWPSSPIGSVATNGSIENRPAAPVWARKNPTLTDNPPLPATATPVFAATSPAHPSPLAPAITDAKPSPSSTAAPQNPAPASSIVLRAPTIPTMPAQERLQQQTYDSGIPATSAISTTPNTSTELSLHEPVAPDARALRAQSLAQPMTQDAGHNAMTAAAPMQDGAPSPARNFGSAHSIPPALNPMQPAALHPADTLNRLMQAQPLGVRMVARRLEQAMTPVFDRAHAAIEPAISINAGLDADNSPSLPADGNGNGNAGSFPSSQVKNTFNVNVSLAGGERYGPAELEQMRDALMQVLGEAARRQGLDV